MSKILISREKAAAFSYVELIKIELRITELEKNLDSLSPREENELKRFYNERDRMRDLHSFAMKPTLLEKVRNFLGF